MKTKELSEDELKEFDEWCLKKFSFMLYGRVLCSLSVYVKLVNDFLLEKSTTNPQRKG